MDPITLLVVGVAAVFGLGTAAGILSSMMFTTPQKHETLITTFGRHSRTVKDAGLHFKKPWPFDKVYDQVSTQLEQTGENLQTKTKDNIFVTLPISIQFEISDTAKFTFDVDKPVEQIKKIVSAAVRKYTSGKDFQELYNERDEISERVIEEVSKHVSEYGVVLRRIVIDEPQVGSELQSAYNKVRASEREREAAVNESEAIKLKTVKIAEAERDRDLLRGEGAAGYRQRIFDQYAEQIKKLEAGGVPREEAVTVMMQIMHLDTVREVGSHGNTVIVTPDANTGDAFAQFKALSQTLTKPAANDKPAAAVTPKAGVGGPAFGNTA